MSANRNDLLFQAMKFDASDLDANRSGMLSERQSRLLASQRSAVIVVVLIRGIIGGAAFIALCLQLPSDLANISPATPGNLLIDLLCLIYIVLTLVYIRMIVRRWRLFALDLHNHQVAFIEGRVFQRVEKRFSVKPLRINTRPYYFIQIGAQRFGVFRKTMLAFEDGAPYQVFYAPHSKTVVSAEAIRAEGES